MTKAIPGKRKRGRPKTRWKDVCKRDMQTVGLREGDEYGNPAFWLISRIPAFLRKRPAFLALFRNNKNL